MSRVLSFHYVLTNKKGETIDSSRDAEPMPVLEGSQQIIPGLETELFQMKIGDKKKIYVTADKAYGLVREDLRVKVGRDQFPDGEIKAGVQFSAGEGHGPVFTVIKVEGDDVYLDGNHSLAGEDLTFDVEVTDIREASEEEKQHGHAHGPHGHHH